MDTGLIYYLIIINIFTALLTLADKTAAIKNKRRVPERTLLLLAVLGGSPGLYLSMQIFRHKTRHAKFYLGVPLIMLVQVALYFLIT